MSLGGGFLFPSFGYGAGSGFTSCLLPSPLPLSFTDEPITLMTITVTMMTVRTQFVNSERLPCARHASKHFVCVNQFISTTQQG